MTNAEIKWENGIDLMLTIDELVSIEQLHILVKLQVNPQHEIEMALLEEIRREDEMFEVSLEEDIYSIGFVTFL